MKTFFVLVVLALCSLMSKSQEYSFPIYFEDSAGNKVTLDFGFDQSASFGIDESLGELNLLGQAYDSTFSVFFTDAVTKEEWDCRLENEKTSTYLTKRQYINLWNDRFIEIGLKAKNWPVKISWDQKSIKDFDIDQYLENKDYGLFLTSWRPLNGYPDVFCCGEWPTPNGLTWLSEATEIQIGKSNACQYKANFSNDSISLIYVSQMYKYTSVKDFPQNSLKSWYNEFLDAVSIQSNKGEAVLKLEIFNIWGMKVMEKEILATNGELMNITISHLIKGLYFIRLSELNDNSLASTFKIIKR